MTSNEKTDEMLQCKSPRLLEKGSIVGIDNGGRGECPIGLGPQTVGDLEQKR